MKINPIGENEYASLRVCAGKIVYLVGDMAETYGTNCSKGVPPDYKGMFSLDIGGIMLHVARAYSALGFPIVEDPIGDLKEYESPKLDMIFAKIVHFSSNIFSVAYAYPEEALESGVDYDLKQLVYFLQFLCKELKVDLPQICKNKIDFLNKLWNSPNPSATN